MKSLEKDRSRRYETASAFAADIQRYLDNETVEACPPSAGYRLRKYVWRNRRSLSTAGLVAAALVAATFVSFWQAHRSRAAQHLAEADRDKAAASEKKATAISNFLEFDLLRQVNSDDQLRDGYSVVLHLTVKEALDRAAAKIGDRFRDQPLVEAALRKVIGDAYLALNQHQFASLHLRRAAEIYEAYLGPDHADTLNSRNSLAMTTQWLNLPEAIAILADVLERRRATLGQDHVDTLGTMNSLGEACRKAGQLDRAYELIQKVLSRETATRGPDDSSTVNSVHDLGLVCRDMGKYAEAIDLLESATTKLAAMNGEYSSNTFYSRENLAGVVAKAGNLEQVNRSLRDLSRIEQLDESLGKSRSMKVIDLRMSLAERLLKLDRAAEAETVLRETLQVCDRAKAARRRLVVLSLLGEILWTRQQHVAAESLLLEAYEGLAPFSDTYTIERLAEATERIVRFYELTNRLEKARAWRGKLSHK